MIEEETKETKETKEREASMKEIVTKVDIRISDDGGKCDENCAFFFDADDVENGAPQCMAFNVELENKERCTQCFAREDVTYQIVGEKE